LAPRKIHTRIHLDPNPAQEVIDPENILRKSERKSLEIGASELDRSSSLPKYGVKSIQDISFDIKF